MSVVLRYKTNLHFRKKLVKLMCLNKKDLRPKEEIL